MSRLEDRRTDEDVLKAVDEEIHSVVLASLKTFDRHELHPHVLIIFVALEVMRLHATVYSTEPDLLNREITVEAGRKLAAMFQTVFTSDRPDEALMRVESIDLPRAFEDPVEH